MAFRRSSSSSKDVKKVSFYVWFLGAKEAKGLRGDEFVLPVLHQLLQQERILEPSKVTLQVSNKGLKIVQNVPKKSSSGKFAAVSNGSASSSSTSSSTNISNGGPNCKMEQIKHLIPHDSITCVVQEDDIVCCLLLIFNPVTKCPVHVHGYRCDSIETAAALKESLQTLIDRPENQKKFAEIEKRLALKHQAMSPAPLHPIPVQVFPLGVSGHLHGHHIPLHPHSHPLHPIPPLHLGAVLHPTGGILPPRILPSSSHRRSAGGSSSDGRSTRTEGSDDSLPGHSRNGRGVFPGTNYPALNGHHQTHMNVSRHSSRPPAVESGDRRSSRNNSFVQNNNNNNEMVKNKSPLRYKHHSKSHQGKEYEMDINEDYRVNEEDDEDLEDEELLQQKQEQFESLAQELKVKLTSGSGPILLPPRDYDTISRRRGNLSGIEQRKSTNKQIVGVLAQIKAKRQEMKELSQTQSSSSTKINNKSNMQSSHRSQEACKEQVVNSTTNRSEASSSGKSSGIGSDEALAVIHDSPSKKSSSSRREITSRATTDVNSSSSSKDNNKMLKKSSLLLQQDHRNHSSNRSSEQLQTRESDDEYEGDFNNEPQQPTSSLRSWKILSDELRERGDIPPPVIPSQIQRSMAAGGINSSSQDRVNGIKLKGATSTSTPPADKTSSSNGVKNENRDTPKYYFPDPSFMSPESRNDNEHSLSPGDDFSHMRSSSDNKILDKYHSSNNSGNKQARKKNPAPAVPSSSLSSSLTSSSSSSPVQNIYLEAGLSPTTSSVAKKTCSSSITNTSEGGSRKQHEQQQQQFSSSSKSNIYSHTTTGNISNACSKSYPSSSSSSRHVILDTNLCKLKQ